ncbi:MAG TPA: prephenate dehydrogenase/arogenate dehydrogenase family protein [Burkholderiales bacterium]|nr:prephenate dehydrogenase/arogenate dehydrogenase family protein [Burkholderiales bacterium]
MRFERVAVIGVGLIGGSFALALKHAKACGHVAGCGRSAENLRLAQERGIVDSVAQDPAAAARGADLILLATPVAQFEKVFSAIAPALGKDAVVTDGGSTKRDVVAAARKGLGAKLAQFVPAHPVAGAEKSGAGAASAELFRGKRVVLTPLAENPAAVVDRVEQAWAACGARISRMDPEEHDAVLAAVSHLPHLLAYALVHEVAGRENSAQLFSFAAGGFRDFTRIASSHPEMWRDICLANRDRLRAELARYSKKLEQVNRLLDEPQALEKLFAEARAARERWIRSS